MRPRAILNALFAVSAVSGFAAQAGAAGPAAVKTEGKMVEFQGGAGKIRGYLAKPQGKGPFPAILVIHEWWGLTDWVKQNADRLAEQGYVALAVDLYGGKETADPAVAHELMRALDDKEGIHDLEGGVSYLQSLDCVDKRKKMGAIGWCMGGKFARLIGEESKWVGPTAICYGSVSTDSSAVEKLAPKPVLGIFGGKDRGIPVSKVREYAELLKKKGSKVELHIYENAGHGFMRPGPSQSAEDAKDAWKRIDEFFAENLKK